MKKWKMMGLCLAAVLALVVCGLPPWDAAVAGVEPLPTQPEDGRIAKRIEDAWAELPESVREALDEELAAQLPMRWRTDPFFGDRLAMLLLNGEQVTLCLFEQSGDAWALVATNDTLISPEDVPEDAPVGFSADGSVSAYLVAQVPFKSQDFVFERDADGTLVLSMFRDMGDTGSAPIYRLDAREGGYLLSERLLGVGRGTVLYTAPGLSIDEVNADGVLTLIREALAARNDAPETPPPHAKDAMPAPETIEGFAAEKALAVYTAPGEDARASEGESLTAGWLQVFGVEDGWALVQHNVADGVNRIGYVPADAVPIGRAGALTWTPAPCVATIGLTLTDDPLRGGGAVLSVAAGDKVTCLASFGDYWAYVEVEDDAGMPARGFVIDAFLVPEAEAPGEPDELGALVAYWIAQYGETRYLSVESKELTRKAYMSGWPSYDAKEYNEVLPMLLRRGAEIMLEDDRIAGVTTEILARLYVPDVHYDPSFDTSAYQIWLATYDTNVGDTYMPCWIAIDAETGDVLGLVPGGNG